MPSDTTMIADAPARVVTATLNYLMPSAETVSYTHLTLPTIYSV